MLVGVFPVSNLEKAFTFTKRSSLSADRCLSNTEDSLDFFFVSDDRDKIAPKL